MTRLKVEIDYLQIAQWYKQIEYYHRLISRELDRAAREQKEKEKDNAS
jgi:hypothetical protein